MKTILATVIAIQINLAFALTETVNGIQWQYRDLGCVAETYYWHSVAAGSISHYYTTVSQSTVGAIEVPHYLGGLPVVSIGNRSFYSCTLLTNVTMPNSVTNIGVMAFYDCSGLTSITIPDSVTSIGEYAFYKCEGLTSVAIPNSVTNIGMFAFSGCTNLTSVTIPQYVCTTRMSSSYAFQACYQKITDITIADGVTSIGTNVFHDCYSLSNIAIPDSVRIIGKQAFYNCTNLEHIAIGSNITNIGHEAFRKVKGAIAIQEGIGRVVFGTNVCDADVNPSLPTKDGIDYVWISDAGKDVADPFHSKTSIAATPCWRVKKIAGLPEGMAFPNTSQEVSLSCGTPGATIYYTTDGSDPAVDGLEYKRPFTVYKTCTVRAVAVKDDYRNSPEATATFTRAEGLSEAANLYGYTMESDGAAAWTVDTGVSHDGVSSVRSGAIGNGGETTLAVSLRKAGTVSFWWRAQCEEAEVDDGETSYYDYGSFIVDGNVVAQIAGNDTGWRRVEYTITSGGKHVLRWKYSKDDATSYSPDCIWVDQVQWVPSDGSGWTMTTPYPVPYSWFEKYQLADGTDYETTGNAASGKTQSGKATKMWEEYVAGTDPTNANSRLEAKIEMKDGSPVVSWSPNLNTNGIERLYKVYGSETLENGGDWQYPTNALHRFFKVTVEMP